QNDRLIQTHGELEAERRRYQELFEFAPDAYVITDLMGVVRQVNRAAVSLFQAVTDLITQKPLITFVPELNRRDFRDLLMRVRQATKVRGEVNFLTRTGVIFPAIVHVVPGHALSGEPATIWWSIRSIAELKQAQQRAFQNERLAGIGQMATGLAHEA